MTMLTQRFLAIAALAAGALSAGGSAWAVDCSALPSPFYGIGGSAQRPLLGQVATRLSALAQPRTLIYQAPGACVGLNSVLNDTRIMGQATYWNAQGAEALCDLPLTGQLPDFATVGNAATLCPGVSALPAGVGDFEGPITTFNVFVPRASSQQSISSAAAYFVFGFGRESGVAPWTDEALIIRRDANSAAHDFGVALGNDTGGNGGGNGGGDGPEAPAPAPRTAHTEDECEGAPTRPRVISMEQPEYPDAAREAEVEGRVRVELRVDATGAVVSARVLEGLGHGLDEAALAAARAARFEPATRCGRPVEATFTVGVRFAL